MRKQIFLTVSLLLTVSACVQPGQVTTQDRDYPACERKSVVTINLRGDPPRVIDPHICTSPGTTIRFNLVPRPASSSVMLIAKTRNPDGGGFGNWLTVANTINGGFIEATVPNLDRITKLCGSIDNDDCYFDYAVYAAGKEPIDPRVTVKR